MTNKQPHIIAKQLITLLATRHNRDVFVPECYTDPDSLQRIDAWAMKKSWSHPLTIGYEVKVTRGDFLRDEKWQGYLPFCNEFLFVAPPGVIDASEVPGQAGLLVCSRNATRLYCKKKSPYRELELPSSLCSLLTAVLWNRASVTQHDTMPSANAWRKWLDSKRDLHDLGSKVSRALNERIEEEIIARDSKQEDLERANSDLLDAKRMLTDLGFAPGAVPRPWQVESRLEDLQAAVPPDAVFGVKRAITALRDVETAFDKMIADNPEA